MGRVLSAVSVYGKNNYFRGGNAQEGLVRCDEGLSGTSIENGSVDSDASGSWTSDDR